MRRLESRPLNTSSVRSQRGERRHSKSYRDQCTQWANLTVIFEH